MNTKEEQVGDTNESGRGPYSDYIDKNYIYSRTYMNAEDYQRRITAMALVGVSVGTRSVRIAMKYGGATNRKKPGTEKWLRESFQILDDEHSLRVCISGMFNIKKNAKERKLLFYEPIWQKVVDEYLATKPTIMDFEPHMSKFGSVNMDELIPMWQVMKDGNLPWVFCEYFVRFVSRAMTAYVNTHMPEHTYVRHKGKGPKKPIKFWYRDWFHKQEFSGAN